MPQAPCSPSPLRTSTIKDQQPVLRSLGEEGSTIVRQVGPVRPIAPTPRQSISPPHAPCPMLLPPPTLLPTKNQEQRYSASLLSSLRFLLLNSFPLSYFPTFLPCYYQKRTKNSRAGRGFPFALTPPASHRPRPNIAAKSGHLACEVGTPGFSPARHKKHRKTSVQIEPQSDRPLENQHHGSSPEIPKCRAKPHFSAPHSPNPISPTSASHSQTHNTTTQEQSTGNPTRSKPALSSDLHPPQPINQSKPYYPKPASHRIQGLPSSMNSRISSALKGRFKPARKRFTASSKCCLFTACCPASPPTNSAITS